MPAQRVTETWLFTFLVLSCYSEMMDIWKHGKYVDAWSVVHFLSGFLLVGLSYKLDLDFVLASLTSIGALVLWEVFEWLVKIIEPSINVIVDILIGTAGVVFGVFLFYFVMGTIDSVFYSTLVLTLVLSLWGFLDFYKKGYR